MALMYASLANVGGQKMIDTSAPVFPSPRASHCRTPAVDQPAALILMRDGGARLACSPPTICVLPAAFARMDGGLTAGDAHNDLVVPACEIWT